MDVSEEEYFSYHSVSKVGAHPVLTVTSGTPEGRALLKALTPQDKSVMTLLREESYENCHPTFYIRILENLVASGKLALEDFEEELRSER